MEITFTYSLTSQQRQLWIEFWAQSPHSHPRQHPDFAGVIIGKGEIPLFVMAIEDHRPVMVGLFSLRPWLWGKRGSIEAVCLSGPVFDEVRYAEEAMPKIIVFFRRLWVGRMRIRPYWNFPEGGSLRSRLAQLGIISTEGPSGSRQTGIIALQKTDDEFLDSFSKSARREVRRAERQEVEVREAYSEQDAEIFFQELNRMNRQRGMGCIPDCESRAMFDTILRSRDLGVILNAYHQDVYLGGLMMIRSAHTAHTSHFVVVPNTLSALSNLRLAPLIWWRGMQWARDKGCVKMDVEGYMPPSETYRPSYFIHKYKGEFNPEQVENMAQYAAVCRPVVNWILKGYSIGSRIVKLPFRIHYRQLVKSRYQRLVSKTKPADTDSPETSKSQVDPQKIEQKS